MRRDTVFVVWYSVVSDMPCKDRRDAGRKLAPALKKELVGVPRVLLYALPRGGVVVGAEVAETLRLPLDVIVTRKIGAPGNEEFAIGALAETGETVWNEREKAGHEPSAVAKIVKKETEEAKRRINAYRNGRRLPSFAGRTVVIIDDGIATGLTMRAAVMAARHQLADRIIVAVPHGARESIKTLRDEGVRVVALEEPVFYGAVGQYYDTFPQVEDADVIRLLTQSTFS